MLTAKNVATQTAAQYFTQGYYQEGSSRWFGKGAEKLGLSGNVDSLEIFSNVVNGLSPDGSETLCARSINKNSRRACTDFTFSAPKSVSLTALVGGDNRLKEAHQQAVEKTLALIESRYAITRVTEGQKRKCVNTGNLVAAQFDHIESRELDPHLHTHALVMNATQLENGEWYSLLNDEIFANKKFLGTVYQSYLADLVQKLGYEISPQPHGQFEIKGYQSQDLINFSKRRQQILASEKDRSTWSLREEIWSSTRKRKEKIDPEELVTRWREQAKDLGINFVKPKQDFKYQPQPITQEILTNAIAHCSERKVSFSIEELEQFVLNERLAADISTVSSQFKVHPELISLSENKVSFTTQTAVMRERKTIRLMQEGLGQFKAIATLDAVNDRLEKTTLNSGQRSAVQLAATTTDQFIAWQGVAGAGKTFALKQLKAIANDSGHNIKCFAPSSEAAKVLGEELGLTAETVASLLVSEPPAEIEPNQLWIVDEAGLLSAKVALDLLERAKNNRAKVVLVGDIKQLSAVEAGNPFKSLQQAGIKTAYLTESNRQRNPELKFAVDLIASDRVEAGFKYLDSHDYIQHIDESEKIEAIANEYIAADPLLRSKTLVLAGTNAEARSITQAIRQKLMAESGNNYKCEITQLKAKNLTTVQMRYAHNFDVGDAVIPTQSYKRRGLDKGKVYFVAAKNQDSLTLQSPDGKQFDVDTQFYKTIYQQLPIDIVIGDRMKWTKNDRQLGRRNGQEFALASISGSSATIKYDDGRTENIDLTQPQHLDHALVHTIYSSQGKTADRVLIAGDYTIGKESFYVAISRASHQLKLYTSDAAGLLSQAQTSIASSNPLEILQQLKERSASKPVESTTTEVNKQTDKPTPAATIVKPVVKNNTNENIAPITIPEWLEKGKRVYYKNKGWGSIENISERSLSIKLDTGELSRILDWSSAINSKLIVPEPHTAFWVKTTTTNETDRIDSAHWKELENSAIHPEIAAKNFKSLHFDDIEGEHAAWSYLMYSDELARTNTGRLSNSLLKKYAHIEAGGWWCDSGVDSRSFEKLQPGEKPQKNIWGCFKPNNPRSNPEKPDKKIKYEHPPNTNLSLFLLDVPDMIADRIYEKYGVSPTKSDRTSGFWYCVWKHNLPITITEGAKKAASLLSQGFATIGLPGIYAGYRSKDDQGNKIKPQLMDELAVFATLERDIKICFDYEQRPSTKRNIDIAISRTGGLLERSGACVNVVNLPGPDKGVDDFIAVRSGLAYEKLYCEASSLNTYRRNNFTPRDSDNSQSERNQNSRDIQSIIKEINGFNDQDFLLLSKLVSEYFSTDVSRPPSLESKQTIQSEIDKLSQEINSLREQYDKTKRLLDFKYINPFQVFSNSTRDLSLKAQSILADLRSCLIKKKQFETQLVDWDKNAIAHQSWNTLPRTIEIKKIASVLELPQMKLRLDNIKQSSQAQETFDLKSESSRLNHQRHKGFIR